MISILQANNVDTTTSFIANDLEDILLDSKNFTVTYNIADMKLLNFIQWTEIFLDLLKQVLEFFLNALYTVPTHHFLHCIFLW